MTVALIKSRRAYWNGKEWEHPKTGVPLSMSAINKDDDVLILSVEDAEGDEIIGMILNRTTMEQIRDGIDNTLNRNPIVIRKMDA